MSSPTKILKEKNGVIISEVQLLDNSGAVASIAYVVTSKKTPETQRFNTLEDAEKLFEQWARY